jgi:phosphoglucomutase
MPVHPLAGKRATPDMLIDPDRLEREYYDRKPDLSDPAQLVSFGTSGHRGSSGNGSFTEQHILAIAQAICEYRAAQGINGPLFMGADTHALSAPAQRTALEVLAANGVNACIQAGRGPTPTPSISRAIVVHNRERAQALADGIVVTPSHNPPQDGGFKYNPPHGGPADTAITSVVEARANELLHAGNRDVKRIPYERALRAPATQQRDFVAPYVRDLGLAIDMEAIRAAGLRLGADPLGGASLPYWEPIALEYGLNLEIVNQTIDPTFRFMTLDHDGQIRMDCSSPFAMAGLVALKDRFDVAFGNDPDSDRHGIVARSAGLMNPNHYLAVAIRYLLTHRALWRADSAVGKTVVSSSLIDRVVRSLGNKLAEVPVGFKWFSQGLLDGSFCFGGEESAGASFLERGGAAWSTDKDGILLDLLAAELTARTGKDPGENYAELIAEFGEPLYTRIDVKATPVEKKRLGAMNAASVTASELAGEPIEAVMTQAPANGAPIGGVKVMARNGWFAARPSGTENIYKIYAESFRSARHLESIVSQAQEIVAAALRNGSKT